MSEEKLESRRRFLKTNLGRVLAGAAIASGLNRVANAYDYHVNSHTHVDYEAGGKHYNYTGHIDYAQHVDYKDSKGVHHNTSA